LRPGRCRAAVVDSVLSCESIVSGQGSVAP
jgi:hypothetical protein